MSLFSPKKPVKNLKEFFNNNTTSINNNNNNSISNDNEIISNNLSNIYAVDNHNSSGNDITNGFNSCNSIINNDNNERFKDNKNGNNDDNNKNKNSYTNEKNNINNNNNNNVCIQLPDNKQLKLLYSTHKTVHQLVLTICSVINISQPELFGLKCCVCAQNHNEKTKNNFDTNTNNYNNDESKPCIHMEPIASDNNDDYQLFYLDPDISIRNQISSSSSFSSSSLIHLKFCVLFYVSDVNLIIDDVTRYYYYHNVKNDVTQASFDANQQLYNQSLILTALALQAEIGDYDKQPENYLDNFLVFNQNDEEEEELISLVKHQIKDLQVRLKGTTPQQAQYMYIHNACKLQCYSMQFYPVYDFNGTSLLVGSSCQGLHLRPITSFQPIIYLRWCDITGFESIIVDNTNKNKNDDKKNTNNINNNNINNNNNFNNILMVSCNSLKEDLYLQTQTSQQCKYLAQLFNRQRAFYKLFPENGVLLPETEVPQFPPTKEEKETVKKETINKYKDEEEEEDDEEEDDDDDAFNNNNNIEKFYFATDDIIKSDRNGKEINNNNINNNNKDKYTITNPINSINNNNNNEDNSINSANNNSIYTNDFNNDLNNLNNINNSNIFNKENENNDNNNNTNNKNTNNTNNKNTNNNNNNNTNNNNNNNTNNSNTNATDSDNSEDEDSVSDYVNVGKELSDIKIRETARYELFNRSCSAKNNNNNFFTNTNKNNINLYTSNNNDCISSINTNKNKVYTNTTTVYINNTKDDITRNNKNNNIINKNINKNNNNNFNINSINSTVNNLYDIYHDGEDEDEDGGDDSVSESVWSNAQAPYLEYLEALAESMEGLSEDDKSNLLQSLVDVKMNDTDNNNNNNDKNNNNNNNNNNNKINKNVMDETYTTNDKEFHYEPSQQGQLPLELLQQQEAFIQQQKLLRKPYQDQFLNNQNLYFENYQHQPQQSQQHSVLQQINHKHMLQRQLLQQYKMQRQQQYSHPHLYHNIYNNNINKNINNKNIYNNNKIKPYSSHIDFSTNINYINNFDLPCNENNLYSDIGKMLNYKNNNMNYDDFIHNDNNKNVIYNNLNNIKSNDIKNDNSDDYISLIELSYENLMKKQMLRQEQMNSPKQPFVYSISQPDISFAGQKNGQKKEMPNTIPPTHLTRKQRFNSKPVDRSSSLLVGTGNKTTQVYNKYRALNYPQAKHPSAIYSGISCFGVPEDLSKAADLSKLTDTDMIQNNSYLKSGISTKNFEKFFDHPCFQHGGLNNDYRLDYYKSVMGGVTTDPAMKNDNNNFMIKNSLMSSNGAFEDNILTNVFGGLSADQINYEKNNTNNNNIHNITNYDYFDYLNNNYDFLKTNNFSDNLIFDPTCHSVRDEYFELCLKFLNNNNVLTNHHLTNNTSKNNNINNKNVNNHNNNKRVRPKDPPSYSNSVSLNALQHIGLLSNNNNNNQNNNTNIKNNNNNKKKGTLKKHQSLCDASSKKLSLLQQSKLPVLTLRHKQLQKDLLLLQQQKELSEQLRSQQKNKTDEKIEILESSGKFQKQDEQDLSPTLKRSVHKQQSKNMNKTEQTFYPQHQKLSLLSLEQKNIQNQNLIRKLLLNNNTNNEINDGKNLKSIAQSLPNVSTLEKNNNNNNNNNDDDGKNNKTPKFHLVPDLRSSWRPNINDFNSNTLQRIKKQSITLPSGNSSTSCTLNSQSLVASKDTISGSKLQDVGDDSSVSDHNNIKHIDFKQNKDGDKERKSQKNKNEENDIGRIYESEKDTSVQDNKISCIYAQSAESFENQKINYSHNNNKNKNNNKHNNDKNEEHMTNSSHAVENGTNERNHKEDNRIEGFGLESNIKKLNQDENEVKEPGQKKKQTCDLDSSAEFEAIQIERARSDCRTGCKDTNKKRNRLSNVLPYEDNRIVLNYTSEDYNYYHYFKQYYDLYNNNNNKDNNKNNNNDIITSPSLEDKRSLKTQSMLNLDPKIWGSNPDGYINASRVCMDVGKEEVNFIAAQGPLEETVEDFWQMVWQEDCVLIAMVARSDENKCHAYFPQSSASPSLTFNNFQIDLVSGPSVQNSYHTRLLKITKTTLRSRVEKKKKKFFLLSHMKVDSLVTVAEHKYVYHLQYQQWPLDGVPSDLDAFLDYLDAIESISRQWSWIKINENEGNSVLTSENKPVFEKNIHHSSQNLFSKSKSPKGVQKFTNETPPHSSCIIHCSNGVGRSGVVLLTLLARKVIDHNLPFDLASLLTSLRLQRMRLVTTISQYNFVKKLLEKYLGSCRLI